jgi:hypothetical protein
MKQNVNVFEMILPLVKCIVTPPCQFSKAANFWLTVFLQPPVFEVVPVAQPHLSLPWLYFPSTACLGVVIMPFRVSQAALLTLL